MIFKIAVCDDEVLETSLISNYILRFSMAHDVDFETRTFLCAESLLNEYKQPGAFHIVFLDIEMNGISGLEAASRIRGKKDRNAKIIFISNYPKYMQDSFQVQPFHFLTKPLEYSQFENLMIRIIQDFNDSSVSRLLVQKDGTEEMVELSQIFSIKTLKGKKNLLEISFSDRILTVTGNIGEWEKDLRDYGFFSPGRGYLVNLNQIHFVNNSELIMMNQEHVPLSRRREKEFHALFSKRILNTYRN